MGRKSYITFSILGEFEKELSNVTIEGLSQKIEMNWKIYKQRKRQAENDYGDIALLVDLNYPDKDRIEGVAFLDPKLATTIKSTIESKRYLSA